MYLRAIEAAPADADCLRNFAVFLSEKLKDFARADDYFARAIQAIFLPLGVISLHDVTLWFRPGLMTVKLLGSIGVFCAKN